MGKLLITEEQYHMIMEDIALHAGSEENIPKYTHEISKILSDAKEYLKKSSSVVLNLTLQDILDNEQKHVSVFTSFEKTCEAYRKKANVYYNIDDSLDERGIEYEKRQNFSDMVQEMDRISDDIDTMKGIYEDLMNLAVQKKNYFDYLKKTFPPDITNI